MIFEHKSVLLMETVDSLNVKPDIFRVFHRKDPICAGYNCAGSLCL